MIQMCRIVPQVYRALAGFAALMLLLCGCSHGSKAGGAASTVNITTTETETLPAPATSSHGPVDVGPTTTTTTACPILSAATAAADEGVRLGRITTQLIGATAVGCEFYADQDPSFKASEHLPGPNQPVLQIVSSRYTDEITAQNAMVAIAKAGQNIDSSNPISADVPGAAFQVMFDPADGSNDWAYVFRTGTTVVTVTTAQTDTSFDAREVAAAIVTKF
jgi:hypothetical protein